MCRLLSACLIFSLLFLSSCGLYEDLVAGGTTTGNAIVEINIPPYTVNSSFTASAKLIAVVFTTESGKHVHPIQLDIVFDGSSVAFPPIPIPEEVYTSVAFLFSSVSFTNAHGSFVSVSEVTVSTEGASFFGDVNDFSFDITEFVSNLDNAQSGEGLDTASFVDCDNPVPTSVLFEIPGNSDGCLPLNGVQYQPGEFVEDIHYHHELRFASVPIPSTGAACGITLELSNEDFIFEGDFVLAVNDHVLAGSINLETYLVPSPGPGVEILPFLFFDWDLIYGNGEYPGETYCRGLGDDSCRMPQDDSTIAPLYMWFGSEHLAGQEIAPKSQGQANLPKVLDVQLIGFGDDADECSFSAVQGEMVVYYPEPSPSTTP